jgi:ubiquinone/menaquinone biosynthesis C-methylase UbiE
MGKRTKKRLIHFEAKLSQDEVRRVYDTLSKMYDFWGILTESRARKRAIELAEIKNNEKILEVAVGTGLAFYEIVKRNPDGMNVGIDISEGMLNKAKKRMSKLRSANYELKIASAFSIPYPDATFDLIINNYMFDLIPFDEMDKILNEFKRVLKDNARLVIVNMTEGKTLLSRIYELIYKFSPRLLGGCRGIMMKEHVASAGFRVIISEYIQQMLFPSEVILAKK